MLQLYAVGCLLGTISGPMSREHSQLGLRLHTAAIVLHMYERHSHIACCSTHVVHVTCHAYGGTVGGLLFLHYVLDCLRHVAAQADVNRLLDVDLPQ